MKRWALLLHLHFVPMVACHTRILHSRSYIRPLVGKDSWRRLMVEDHRRRRGNVLPTEGWTICMRTDINSGIACLSLGRFFFFDSSSTHQPVPIFILSFLYQSWFRNMWLENAEPRLVNLRLKGMKDEDVPGPTKGWVSFFFFNLQLINLRIGFIIHLHQSKDWKKKERKPGTSQHWITPSLSGFLLI